MPASTSTRWAQWARALGADPVGCARQWTRRRLEEVRAWTDNRAAEERSMREARERTGFRGAWLNGGAP